MVRGCRQSGTKRRQVVVFDKYSVGEIEAMIRAATDSNGVLFEST